MYRYEIYITKILTEKIFWITVPANATLYQVQGVIGNLWPFMQWRGSWDITISWLVEGNASGFDGFNIAHNHPHVHVHACVYVCAHARTQSSMDDCTVIEYLQRNYAGLTTVQIPHQFLHHKQICIHTHRQTDRDIHTNALDGESILSITMRILSNSLPTNSRNPLPGYGLNGSRCVWFILRAAQHVPCSSARRILNQRRAEPSDKQNTTSTDKIQSE